MKKPRRYRYPLAEPLTNRPHLRVRRDERRAFRHVVFHPTSGYCPRQIKKLVAKVVMNSTYGKFGDPSVSREPREPLDDELARSDHYGIGTFNDVLVPLGLYR